MKVTFVLKTIPRTVGGGSLMIFKYANYLAEHKHQVELLIEESRMWERVHLPEVIRRILVCQSIKIRPTWFQLDSQIRKTAVFDPRPENCPDADAIFATSVDTAHYVASLPDTKGRKLYFIQDFENWVLPDNLVNETFRLGMKNITVSKWLSKIVDQQSSTESITIPNGIDSTIFHPLDKKNNSKKLHSIVFQYRSNENKGCRYSIKVIERIKERYPDLVVHAISNEKRPLDLPKFVFYHRNISQKEVSKIYNDSTLFICSSIDEGFGLPGLEAMACGCAVVSSNYEGIHEYAKDGFNALLSPVKDVDSMVDNIIKLFENASLLEKITINGIQTSKIYSFEKSAQIFAKAIMDHYDAMHDN